MAFANTHSSNESWLCSVWSGKSNDNLRSPEAGKCRRIISWSLTVDGGRDSQQVMVRMLRCGSNPCGPTPEPTMYDAGTQITHHRIVLGASGVMGAGPYLTSYYHHTGALPIFHPVFLCGLRDQRHWSLFILRDVDRLCRDSIYFTLLSLSLQSHALQYVHFIPAYAV